MLEVHATEATEGAVGGEQDCPLENDPEDYEDEEEEMERLLDEEKKKKNPDFDQMIDEEVRAGNIRLKVHRSIEWVMRLFQGGKKLKALSFVDIA